MQNLTVENISLAIGGIVLVLSGIYKYFVNLRSPTVPPGVYRVSNEERDAVHQLKRIADALELANDERARDFQDHTRKQLDRLEEAINYRKGQ